MSDLDGLLEVLREMRWSQPAMAHEIIRLRAAQAPASSPAVPPEYERAVDQAVEALRELLKDLQQEDHPGVYCCGAYSRRRAQSAIAAVDAARGQR